MRVKFWGVRGSIPTPGAGTVRYGGNTPCVEVRCGDTLLIIDAGSGIRELGNALMAEGRPVRAHLLISHTHWDHLQGFPFFHPIYVPGTVLNIYGCRGADESLAEELSGQMTLHYFPVRFSEAAAEMTICELDEGEFQLEGVRVVAMYSNHPGLCLVYRLEWEGKSLVYLCDNEPYRYPLAPHAVEADEELVGDSPAGRDPRFAEFARDADLLIIDCAYTAEEYQQRRGWGHGCTDDVIPIAVEARARRVALFHHDPSHPDDKIDEMVAHARTLLARSGSSMDCFGAREGMELNL